MRRSRAALLGFACSTLLPPAAASSMTSMLIRAASATLVARRTADVEGYQEASAGSSSGSGSGAETSELMQAIHYGAIVLLIVMSAISSGLTLGLMSLDKVSLDVIIRAGDRSGATADEMRKAKAARRILPLAVDSDGRLDQWPRGLLCVDDRHPHLWRDRAAVALLEARAVHWLGARAGCESSQAGVVYLRQTGELRAGQNRGRGCGHHVHQERAAEADGDPCEAEDHAPGGGLYRAWRHELQTQSCQRHHDPGGEAFLASDILHRHAGTILNLETLKMIYNNGYSRIPVWNKDPNDIVGIIFTKDLIYVDPGQDVPLIAFARVFAVAAHRIWLDAQLGEVLSVFKMGSTHMALVYDVNNSGPGDPFYELKGLVTLEDIVEEILQSKIIDETDSPEARKERENCTDKIGYFDGAHAAAAFADQIWIVGGVSASYYTKRLEYTTTRSDVVSSPDGVEWTEVLEEAPFRRRYGHSLIAFTDSSDNVERLTLLGGFSPEPATDIWVTTDGASWTETTITVPWTGRGYHCSVLFNSNLWVLGGSPINNEVWSTSSVLKGPWKQQTGVPWSPRAAHACATHEIMNATVGDSTREKFLFLMGGWRDTSLRDVWRMDSSGSWDLMVESAPWEPRAWFSTVSFDSRTNGDVQLGPRLWVLGGGIVGNGIDKMYPFSDVWYTRDGVEWVEASSNSSGISTAEWSMLTQSNEEVCMGKWGHTVVPFYRTVDRAYYCHESCMNEEGTISLANQLIPVCNPSTTLPEIPALHKILLNNSLITTTLYPDGCGLCVTDPNARYENSTSVPTLFLLAGNVGVQKVNDVFRSSDGSACCTEATITREGTICSGEGVCVQGGTCLCSNGKTGALCDSELPYTIVDSTSCFPESAPVIVLGGKTKRLGDVKIGDSVLALNPAGEPVFSTVYYIPHESFVDGATDFISVEHEGLTHEQDNDFIEALQLTPDHLVYYLQESEVFEANFYRSAWKTRLREPWTASLAQKPASELQVNDLLLMLPSSQSSSPSCAASNTENDPPPRNASRSTCWSCPDGKHGALPCQEEPPAGPTLVRVTRLTRASRRGAKTVYTMTGNLSTTAGFGSLQAVRAAPRGVQVAPVHAHR
ncbi:hypothetical protein ON010_g11519 [Phytophthora cinnamomi]|nr:hypothetical protein ON010_g11519 [Phytophthora cinnamomi]